MTKKNRQSESECLAWFCRSFETSEHWKQQAREIYLRTSGNSPASRRELAAALRANLEGASLKESVDRWASTESGSIAVTTVSVQKPDVDLSKVEWEFIAEFFLLCCRNLDEAMLAENVRRAELNKTARDAHASARRTQNVVAAVRATPSATEAELSMAVPGATKREIALARKQVKDGHLELVAEMPQLLDLIEPYMLVYFAGT